MCGIIGVVGHGVVQDQLDDAIRSLKHRGPDGHGSHIDSGLDVGVAHTRLSIIDLETGGQPLYDETKQIVLVCNGEIYDFENIRSDLESKGHKFSTHSDSEVIIHLYKEYGMDLLEHLRGEFAFILLDKSKNEVIAARDRFGIKPLYFNCKNDKFVFASEAKGIFGTGVVKPELDPVSLRNMISFVPIDSAFQGIEAVPAGCYMRIPLGGNGKKMETHRYWDVDLPKIEDEINDKSFEECVGIVREKFDEAVKLRLRADVPVGVYLSGGVDSAAVVGTVNKYFANELHAFTIAFTADDYFNELDLAKKMAESIGAKLHVAECGHEELMANFEDCLWYSELPVVNLHGVGKFILSKLAREQVKVVLTGEGADEMFLGYEYFQDQNSGISSMFSKEAKTGMEKQEMTSHAVEIEENFGFVPQGEHLNTLAPKRQKFFRKLFHRKDFNRLTRFRAMKLLKDRVDRSQVDGRSLKKKIQYYSIKGIMTPYILSVLGDRQEMGHALEGRTPLLDHVLFDAARQIPDDYKIMNNKEKYIFREAMKDRIIPEIYNNKKWPYTAPPIWMSESTSPTVKKLLTEHLSKEAIEYSKVFDYKTIRNMRMIHKVLPEKSILKQRINFLLIFCLSAQILHKLYVQQFAASVNKYHAVDY